MEKEILYAIYEQTGVVFDDLKQAKENLKIRDILDCWLSEEGILNYTDGILEVIQVCGGIEGIDV